jgi:enamine deaminase RidA (YjgF/YER057c/UK114 family)
LAAALVLWAATALAMPQEESGTTERQGKLPQQQEVLPREQTALEDMDGRPAGIEPAARPGGAEARLAEIGIELPKPPPPVANYVRAVRTGNLVFLAGHGPLEPGGGYVTGKLGKDLTVEEGYRAARLTGIALLASLKAEIGSLDRVRRIVRVEGMVNATADFTDQSKVINGCSDFLVEVFGERGKHARAAVGMVSLPIGLAVEIHMVVEVE